MRRRPSKLIASGIAVLAMASGARPVRADADIKMRYLFVTYGFSSSQRFSRPSGMFYNASRSELYVADTGNGQIVILDKTGNPVARIPHSVLNTASGERNPGEPRGVAVCKNGDILVTDNLCDYLDVLDFRGRSVQKVYPADLLGRPKNSVQPRCLALDAAGNVYLGVSGSPKEILVLTPDLKLKAQMGVEETGESKSITGIWVDKDGRIYATYATGDCVRVYAPDGKTLTSFGTHDSGPNNFSLPSGLVTDSTGRVWALDTLRHVVSVFKTASTSSGFTTTFSLLAIGGRGEEAGDLTFPTAITGDGATLVFVAESTGARVQGFEILPDTVSSPAN